MDRSSHGSALLSAVYSGTTWWAGIATWYGEYESVSLIVVSALFGLSVAYVQRAIHEEPDPIADSPAGRSVAGMLAVMLLFVATVVAAGTLADRADLEPESMGRLGVVAAAVLVLLALLWAWDRLRAGFVSRRA